MPASTLQRYSINTAPVSPERRVSYWEEECRTNLVGFRCSSHSDDGLLAHQTCLDVGQLRIAHTTANAHVIERTPDNIRTSPRESIFVNVILAGETFVYQRGHCAKLQQGEVLIYDARYPYLVGGADTFNLLHIDIPADVFHAQLARADVKKPIHITTAHSTNRLYNRTLSHLLLDLLGGPADAQRSTDALHHQVCDLLGAMLGQSEGGPALSALSTGHLLAAKAYIGEHLDDDSLHADDIAREVGISERHLRRLFAAQDESVADYVLARRLDRARQALLDPRLRSCTVAETAYRCGFASHAHFSRAFKQRYGVTPSELLRGTHH